MFEGTWTALVTPFSDGEVNAEALARLVNLQAEAGVDGVVPCGSTGESATLSHDEHERVISAVIEAADGRLKVLAGTGSNSTAESVKLTRFARSAGADGALLISPYYNKPTQAGHVVHYRAVAEAADLPLVVYNIPGRTGVNLLPETLAELAAIPGIVALKDAAGSMDQAMRTMQLAGDDLTVLSGDDSLTLPLMALGAGGVIAVVSNLLPTRMKALVDAAAAGQMENARNIHRELLPLMQAMSLETNPIPVKTAMQLAGRCSAEMRLPLTPMTAENSSALEAVMRGYDLLQG
ncbi:MAG: 4-hydroxy-tetrahydrodipicolinate synthase [Proteobacteria bacterium]|nr:4-hydroxy-tetrahydrodipicolinate synthase [Pseudomonadota bacterium]